MENTHSVELSQVAFEFLQRLAETDHVIALTLTTCKGREVRMDRARAEGFCDRLTALLAEIGFDENYELTTDGHLIEGMIDQFNVN